MRQILRNKYKYLLLGAVFHLGFVHQNEIRPVTIKIKHDFFSVDNIGNIYTVKEDEMVKHLANGKFFARYSNLKLGSITNIDVTNPLKLVLYYRDFQQIIFLDNQLSVNSDVVSLETLGYEQTELVCASANNSFWIYEKRNNELHRFNENSKKVTSTGNLKQVLQADINPNYMTEHNGYLFLNSPGTGIYVFDIFGAFSKVIALKGLNQFEVSENIIYYRKDGSLCSYNHNIFEEACKSMPYGSLASQVKYVNNRLVSGFKDSVKVQKF
jgi:hypothetical protein